MVGSILVVLTDGSHITRTATFAADWTAEFAPTVRRWLKEAKASESNIRTFYYAYGKESQQHTPAEVAEVFLGR